MVKTKRYKEFIMKRYIPYGRQSIDKKDILSLVKVLKSKFLTQGPEILKFEKALAEKCGAKYAVVVNSGTAALHLAYKVLDLKTQNEFITSPMTFAATANAGLYLGAKPLFVDIKKNGNIDEEKIEEKITLKTKLIVPVHYAGNPCNLRKIFQIAKKHNLFIIEDASHALGAKFEDSSIGSCHYSDMTIFSFHPVKHITTGEGGAILTNDKNFYKKLLMLRTHGITKEKKLLRNTNQGDWWYEMQELGYNYRLTDLQAALGNSQLKKLDEFVEKRRKIGKEYDNRFSGNQYFDTIHENPTDVNSYHLYPIFLKDKYKKSRKKIFNLLRSKGIGVQVHYIPVYWHPYYERLGFKKNLCPQAESFYEREISLPMYFEMTKNDIKYVVKTLFNLLHEI